MKIHVLFFGSLTDISPPELVDYEVPAGSTVADLMRALTDAYPALEPSWGHVAVALNQQFALRTRALTEGDDVAFLPPVSGG